MGMSNKKYIKEACVEGLTQAINAEKQGADRLELCARLDLDGLTPDNETIMAVHQNCHIPIRVIIRPKPGGFIYTETEFLEMKSSIETCKKIGVEGVVFGITTTKNTLDISKIKQLTQLAYPMKVTIHKAIDTVENPLDELNKLMQIKGIHAVLTSGKENTWVEGQELIKAMVKKAGRKIEIITCGKVTNQNIETVHKTIQARAYHGKLIVEKL